MHEDVLALLAEEVYVVKHLSHVLHPWLLAHDPSYGGRGEEAETLALGKVLRAVVAEVELAHITIVEGVGQASGNALLAVVLNVAIVKRLLVV